MLEVRGSIPLGSTTLLEERPRRRACRSSSRRRRGGGPADPLGQISLLLLCWVCELCAHREWSVLRRSWRRSRRFIAWLFVSSVDRDLFLQDRRVFPGGLRPASSSRPRSVARVE